MTKPSFLACCALALLASPPAWADEPEEAAAAVTAAAAAPTFYATATVRERRRDDATAAVTVIDRRTIEETGAASVAEVLAFVPGVHLESGATRGGLTVARIRGGDPNFTLVLVDGVPVNDGTYQIGEVFNFEALPAAAVERIEIVRGPISALYGSTGLAGAIHIFTRQGTPGPVKGEAALTAGDASYARAHASLAGGTGGRSNYFLSLLHEGEDQRIADESFELNQLQGRFQLALTERASLRLAGRWADWQGDDYPDASGGPALGSGELRRAENREASLGAELALGDRHKFTAAVYRHDLERTSPAVGFLVPRSAETTRFTRTRLGWATTFEPGQGLRLSAGADVEREDGRNTSVLFLPPFLGGEVPGSYDLERTTSGLYTELVADRGRWTFEAGARVDFPEDAADQLSPRLGVGYRLGDATRLRASAGRSFKLPSFFALASPRALGGNPDLRPEVMEGFDVGVERSWSAAGATASLAYFHNRFRELVDFDFATFLHVNRDEVIAEGVEATVAARPHPRLAVAANLTWQDVEDRATGQPVRHRPEWVGGLRLDWNPAPRVDLHLDLRSVSQRYDEQIPVPTRRTVDGYRLLGLAGNWRLTPRLALEARLDNLTDESYETMIGFPGAERSGRVGLRWSFGATSTRSTAAE